MSTNKNKKEVITADELSKDNMEIRSLESIKHKYFEIGKKEGKIKLADVEKDCSHLKLDENEIDELYSFFADNNIIIDEYKEAEILESEDILDEDSYEDLKEHPTLITLAYWTSKIGLLRYFPESFYIKNPTLTETERQQYKLLAYKQLMSQAMLHESRLAKENAKKVPSSINPKIPALLLVSNGEGTTFSQSEWQRYAERFASDQSNVQVDYMDAPHDLYHYQSDAIVSRIKKFLENN